MKQRLLILLIMGLFRDLFFGCEDEKNNWWHSWQIPRG
jgi:hypothetical protein